MKTAVKTKAKTAVKTKAEGTISSLKVKFGG
jgi:hypothetical protein